MLIGTIKHEIDPLMESSPYPEIIWTYSRNFIRPMGQKGPSGLGKDFAVDSKE
jgi:hypothetical protein